MLYLANGWDLCEVYWSAACASSLSVRPTKKVLESKWQYFELQGRSWKFDIPERTTSHEFTPYTCLEGGHLCSLTLFFYDQRSATVPAAHPRTSENLFNVKHETIAVLRLTHLLE